MAATYQAFLASPSASALAPNASINYITTTTAVNEPAAFAQIAAKAKASLDAAGIPLNGAKPAVSPVQPAA